MPLVRTTFRETPFEMPLPEAESLRAQGFVVEILGEPEADPPGDGASPDPSDTPDGSTPDGSDTPKTAKPAKEPTK